MCIITLVFLCRLLTACNVAAASRHERRITTMTTSLVVCWPLASTHLRIHIACIASSSGEMTLLRSLARSLAQNCFWKRTTFACLFCLFVFCQTFKNPFKIPLTFYGNVASESRWCVIGLSLSELPRQTNTALRCEGGMLSAWKAGPHTSQRPGQLF